jgi:hypothetical protein
MFDPTVDALIEMGVLMGLTRVSHDFDMIGVYDNPESEYYYEPFSQKALELFDDGAVMVVYIGHGSSDWTEGLTRDQVAVMQCQHRLPIAVFVACTNGAYVGADDSLAEALVWKENGPIVAIGASDETHPYANAGFVYELSRATLDGKPATIGEALMVAKRQLVLGHDDFRKWVDQVARIQVAAADEPILRAQTVNLYNLFGDPAAALELPRAQVAFDPLPARPLDTGHLVVSGTAPGVSEGTALVTLEVDRDMTLTDPLPGSDQATIQANWRAAVNKVFASATVPVHGGAFQATLDWKLPVPGNVHFLKAYVQGGGADAFGSVTLP